MAVRCGRSLCSMNFPAGVGVPEDEPEWLAAVKRFHAILRKHDKPYAGFSFATGDNLRMATEHMFMCLITSDAQKLAEMVG